MTIPDYQTIMLPLLKFVSGGEIHIRGAIDEMASQFELTAEEQNEMLPSGKQRVIANRTYWAGTYLVQADLLYRPKRGYLAITERGREVLASSPKRLDNSFLSQFEEFTKFKSRSNDAKERQPEAYLADNSSMTPEEQINLAQKELEATLRSDLLQRIQSSSPEFFEHLIIDLMTAMGYGKSGSANHVGQSNDGGIDGIISEDALGLDLVFLQAKRYQTGSGIGSKEIQAFAGALVGNGANKGVFITTSHFSVQAKTFADRTPQRVILIDGEELTKLCLQYEVGVRIYRTIEINRIDNDYFEGDEG